MEVWTVSVRIKGFPKIFRRGQDKDFNQNLT